MRQWQWRECDPSCVQSGSSLRRRCRSRCHVRPFGVALLLEELMRKGPQLFMDPSLGPLSPTVTFVQSLLRGAQSSCKEVYKLWLWRSHQVSLILKQVMEEKLNATNWASHSAAWPEITVSKEELEEKLLRALGSLITVFSGTIHQS